MKLAFTPNPYDVHDYLVMDYIFNRQSNTYDVFTCKYVDKLLAAHTSPKVTGLQAAPRSPAGEDIFKASEDSTTLKEEPCISRRKVDIATAVAKYLYRSQSSG